MRTKVIQEKPGLTHVEWALNDVTPRMLDWFWCNQEKADALWHPNHHHDFAWAKGYSVRERGGLIGTIQIAPQSWGDGKELVIRARCEPLEAIPDQLRAYIRHDHAVAFAGIGADGTEVAPDAPALAWRLHQWQKSDEGVMGMSTALTAERADFESGVLWAAHHMDKVANWEVFLPTLYRLYRGITRWEVSPCQSFLLAGVGPNARYANPEGRPGSPQSA